MTPDFPRPHHPLHSELIATLATGRKVKRRVPRMRACDEINEKGKPCVGHLKRWYDAGPDLEGQFGPEIYRCERCHTLYLPSLQETPRTRTLSW